MENELQGNQSWKDAPVQFIFGLGRKLSEAHKLIFFIIPEARVGKNIFLCEFKRKFVKRSWIDFHPAALYEMSVMCLLVTGS